MPFGWRRRANRTARGSGNPRQDVPAGFAYSAAPAKLIPRARVTVEVRFGEMTQPRDKKLPKFRRKI